MAIDFLHSGQTVDAVIAVLVGADGALHTGGLPPAWFPATSANGEEPLKVLEHGDLADYPADQAVSDLCPAILVRGLGPKPTDHGGASGVMVTQEVVRVIHTRLFDQCYTAAGGRESNMTRARERYAKIIGKALFNDQKRRLAVIDSTGDRTDVTLTCSDGAGAQLVNAMWSGWDLGYDAGSVDSMQEVQMIRSLPLPLWAIGCEMTILCRSGGEA